MMIDAAADYAIAMQPATLMPPLYAHIILPPAIITMPPPPLLAMPFHAYYAIGCYELRLLMPLLLFISAFLRVVTLIYFAASSITPFSVISHRYAIRCRQRRCHFSLQRCCCH